MYINIRMIYMYMCIYKLMHGYMAISRLFLCVELSPVVFNHVHVFTCCKSYVLDLVCVVCRMKTVLCAGNTLCHAWF